MARVRMLMDVSGLRGGTETSLGDAWPQHGEILECGISEAESLIAAGIAEPVSAQAEAQEVIRDLASPPKPAQPRTAARVKPPAQP